MEKSAVITCNAFILMEHWTGYPEVNSKLLKLESTAELFQVCGQDGPR